MFRVDAADRKNDLTHSTAGKKTAKAAYREKISQYYNYRQA